MEVFGNQEGSGFWLYGVGAEGIRHEILFDHDGFIINRHLVKNGEGTILFDVTYDQYTASAPLCPLPQLLHVEGKNITGSLVLRFERIFFGQPIPAKTFQITPPNHFLVQKVD
jgi:hypothetical protein